LFCVNQRLRASIGAAFGAAALLVVGCGTNYSSVITPIPTPGPPPQASAWAAFISRPSVTAPGVLSTVDYSGDSIVDQALLGIDPIGFVNDQSGINAFTLNADQTLSGLSISTNFQTHLVTTSTLPPGAVVANLFALSSTVYALDTATNSLDILKGNPASFVQSISLPAGPITATGVTGGQRIYAVSQGVAPDPSNSTSGTCGVPSSVTTNGSVTAIEVASYTKSATIPVGRCPVYAITSTDSKRAFVLNRTDGTVSVIDTLRNTADTTHPTLAVGCNLTANCPLGTSSGPVYAEYYAAGNLLVTANYDDSTISVIDVSLDIYGNDSATFGQTFNIPVGSHPAAVTVLADTIPSDGIRAYTANQSDSSVANGSVTVVNLSTHAVSKTIDVLGHPRTVASIQNSLYGKVYVVSPDSPYATIINTNGDDVSTSLRLSGNGVDVRITSPNASSANTNLTTRIPGSGQPLNTPLP